MEILRNVGFVYKAGESGELIMKKRGYCTNPKELRIDINGKIKKAPPKQREVYEGDSADGYRAIEEDDVPF